MKQVQGTFYNKAYMTFWRILIKGLLRQKGSSGIVRIDKDAGVVRKSTWIYREFGIVENEAFWLKKMSNFSSVPNIIEEGETELILEYAGKNLTAQTLPLDWEDQMDMILEWLRR